MPDIHYLLTMKLTKALIDELCEWVADDVPFRYCAEGVGVSYRMFNNWMSQGEQDSSNDEETLEAELFLRVKKTYASVVRNSVKKIKACDKGWTGEAWIRQRRDNEFMDKQEITSGDEKVVVNLGSIKGKHFKGERDG